MSIGIIIAIVALIGAGVGAYFLFVKKTPLAAVFTPTPTTGWQFLYSTNVTGTPEDFTFPNVDGVHYCAKAAPSGVAMGQTITMVFNVSGDGTLIVADPNDTAPATVRLRVTGSAGTYDEWWGHKAIDLTDGDHTFAIMLDLTEWGGVGGGISQPTDFNNTIAHLQTVGFTFGGPSFAGHGVYASGNKRFTLKSYTIA